MSMTGLPVFDETVQVTNAWLKALMERLDTDDRHRAYLALRATLHAVRDRLVPDMAVNLGAQMPMLVRGFYFDGWQPTRTPTRERHLDDFLAPIQDAFRRDPAADAEDIVRAVLELLAEKLSPGEIDKVMQAMPREIRDLWPATP